MALDTVPLETPTFLAISAMVAIQKSPFPGRAAGFHNFHFLL